MTDTTLEEMSIEELQKKKLIKEIKNNTVWLNHVIKIATVFAPLLAAGLTYVILAKSKYFDTQKDLLDARSTRLEISIMKQQEDSARKAEQIEFMQKQYSDLIIDYDSLVKKDDSLTNRVESGKMQITRLNRDLKLTKDSITRANQKYESLNQDFNDQREGYFSGQYNTLRSLGGYLVDENKFVDNLIGLLRKINENDSLNIDIKALLEKRPTPPTIPDPRLQK